MLIRIRRLNTDLRKKTKTYAHSVTNEKSVASYRSVPFVVSCVSIGVVTHRHSENTNTRVNVPLTCIGTGFAVGATRFVEYCMAR